MSLPAFSVRQAVLVNILFFVAMFAGLGAYLRTPVDFFPEIGFNGTSLLGGGANIAIGLVALAIESFQQIGHTLANIVATRYKLSLYLVVATCRLCRVSQRPMLFADACW